MTPGKVDASEMPRVVYSDITYSSAKVHDERPESFSNPIIATLVTGGDSLMLALLESEVTNQHGPYVFCDTDSLAIVGNRSISPQYWHFG